MDYFISNWNKKLIVYHLVEIITFSFTEHEKDILLNKFSEITEFDVPIHWDLVGLNQNDAMLIDAIRTKVLWQPPNPKKVLNLKHDIKSDGQTTQSLYVENLLKHHK